MDLYNLDKIIALSNEPEKEEDFNNWIQQKEVIPYLKREIDDAHIIVYASLQHVFIHAVLIPNTELDDKTIQDLLGWSHNPFSTWGLVCTSDDAWIEGPLASSSSETLKGGEQIIFGRSFEGDESKRPYFELEQKMSHVLGLHYVSEPNAWCRLDRLGDLEEAVKIMDTRNLPNNEPGNIITAKKEILGEYTSIGKLCLLRMFDFTRFKTGSFPGWGNRNEAVEFGDGTNIFGSLVVSPGVGSYSRGFQVKDISVPKEQITLCF